MDKGINETNKVLGGMFYMTSFAQKFTSIANQIDLYYGSVEETNLNLASMYALTNTSFSGVALLKKEEELKEVIKRDLGTYASLKLEYIQPQFLAYFFTNKEESISIEELINRVRLLLEAGLPKNESSLQSALLLTGGKQHAERAYALFQELKKLQPLLTTIKDIPLCVFITQNEELHSKELAQSIRNYYDSLKRTFRRGNHLQVLAFLLTIFHPQYNEDVVAYVESMKAKFESIGIKITRKYYVSLGVLALHEANVEVINEVKQLFDELKETKYLKYYKANAFQVAIRHTLQHSKKMPTTALTQVQLPYLDNILMIVQFINIIPINAFLPSIPFLD